MTTISKLNKEKCCGCGACAVACPKQCISMVFDSEGFLYPSINAGNCINCGLCSRVCAFNQIGLIREKKQVAYAVKLKNNEIRINSSSGGFFSATASVILRKQGVVYGVAMNDNCKSVTNVRVSNTAELEKLRGSKYLQSLVGAVFNDVRADLESNRYVLFSGTPCQINALQCYLGKQYDKLFTLEIICHGVPSQLVWNKYAEYLEKKYRSTIVRVDFRKKEYARYSHRTIKESNSYNIFNSLAEDPYLLLFSKDICLRPSCYQCTSKKYESNADLTIGDYWGIDDDIPAFNDNKGISIVIVHSKKGFELFSDASDDFDFVNANMDNVIMHNPSYCSSVLRPNDRDRFFDDLRSNSFKQIIREYANLPFKTRLKSRIKRLKIYEIFRRHRKCNQNFSYGCSIELHSTKK